LLIIGFFIPVNTEAAKLYGQSEYTEQFSVFNANSSAIRYGPFNTLAPIDDTAQLYISFFLGITNDVNPDGTKTILIHEDNAGSPGNQCLSYQLSTIENQLLANHEENAQAILSASTSFTGNPGCTFAAGDPFWIGFSSTSGAEEPLLTLGKPTTATSSPFFLIQDNTTGLIWNSGSGTFSIFNASTTININDLFNAGGLSTTTLTSFCDTNLPYDNSSLIQATLTYLPNGLCRFVSYIVIPTTGSLNQFTQLKTDTQARFPFSFITDITNTWETLTASTTLNSPSLEYELFDLGIGSTTPLGNILPNITVFSSTTVKTYFPEASFNIMKGLAAIAILLTLIADIFFTTKNMLKSS